MKPPTPNRPHTGQPPEGETYLVSQNLKVGVCGALAYDTIAQTVERLFAGDAFQHNCKVSDFTEALGGCGANIAYNLSLLGVGTSVFAMSGTDDDTGLLDQLSNYRVDTAGVLRMKESRSARAFIFTDPSGEQFTAFFPGAWTEVGTDEVDMWQTHLEAKLPPDLNCLIQAPLHPDLMVTTLAKTTAELVITSPGQFCYQLDADLARALAHHSHFLVGNRDEVAYLRKLLGTRRVKIIETDGPRDVKIHHGGGHTRVSVPQVPAESTVDPTGCGDAFLAGFAAQLLADGVDIERAVRQGILLAQSCLACTGAMRHDLPEKLIA